MELMPDIKTAAEFLKIKIQNRLKKAFQYAEGGISFEQHIESVVDTLGMFLGENNGIKKISNNQYVVGTIMIYENLKKTDVFGKVTLNTFQEALEVFYVLESIDH